MIKINKTPSQRELRWFAGLWFPAMLGVLGALALKAGVPRQVVVGGWAVGGLLSVVGLAVPAVIRPVFIGLSYATFPIGFVASFIVLGVIYFLLLTPIAAVMRAAGRRRITGRFDRDARSYWVAMTERADDSSYFRQS